MSMTRVLLTGAAIMALAAGSAAAQEKIGAGISMYMQMGGNAGDGATLALSLIHI